MSSTFDANPDVYTAESLFANNEQWLLQFGTENLWLQVFQRPAVHFDQATAGLAESDGGGGFLKHNFAFNSEFTHIN